MNMDLLVLTASPLFPSRKLSVHPLQTPSLPAHSLHEKNDCGFSGLIVRPPRGILFPGTANSHR